MIIISKYKDYYDYLQGIYGRDELKVFHRNINPDLAIRPKDYKIVSNEKPRNFLNYSYTSKAYEPWNYTYSEWLGDKINSDNVYDFYLCGRLYTIEVIELDNVFHYVPVYRHPYNGDVKRLPDKELIQKEYPLEIGKGYKIWTPTKENYKLREPIFLAGQNVKGVPMLSQWNFARILLAEELYAELDIFLGWLNDNPQMPDLDMTEKEKLSSKGFDSGSFKRRK